MNTLKSVGAILAGMIFIVISHSVTDLILESIGVFPPAGQGHLITWMAVTATIYRSIFTVAGGYVTAALAPSRPILHAVILGLIGLVIGTAAAIYTIPMNLGPAWYPIALAVLGLPCTWLGGKLKTR